MMSLTSLSRLGILYTHLGDTVPLLDCLRDVRKSGSLVQISQPSSLFGLAMGDKAYHHGRANITPRTYLVKRYLGN